jgi:hypothetical protein
MAQINLQKQGEEHLWNKVLVIITSALLLIIDISLLIAEENKKEYFDLSGKAGYRYIDTHRYGGRVLEYDYQHSSGTGNIEMETKTDSYRIFLDSEYLNDKDYNLETDIIYGEGLRLFVDIYNLYHNLDHLPLGSPTTIKGGPLLLPNVNPEDKNQADNYGIGLSNRSATLRFKFPKYPAHININGREYEKRGMAQQKFLEESCVNRCHKISQTRGINFITKEINIEGDGHFGPVDIIYNHNIRNFEDKNLSINSPFGPSFGYRKAGIFSHNVNPEIESSSDSIKVHTSLTGRIVSSLAFKIGRRRNEYSTARVHFKNGSGNLTIIPFKYSYIRFRYIHEDIDNKNPEIVMSQDLTKRFSVRDSVSLDKNKFITTFNYRAFKKVNLNGEYERREIKRTNYDLWELPQKTLKEMWKFRVKIKPWKNLDLNTSYTHKDTDNPAYSIEATRSNKGSIGFTWMPIVNSQINGNYKILSEKNKEKDRENKRNTLLLNFLFTPCENININASYFYLKHDIESDIRFGREEGFVIFDDDINYKIRNHTYILSLDYRLNSRMRFLWNIRENRSKGLFLPRAADITEFSAVKFIERGLSFGFDYQFINGLSTSLTYKYKSFNDQVNSYLDGTAQLIMFTFNKKW